MGALVIAATIIGGYFSASRIRLSQLTVRLAAFRSSAQLLNLRLELRILIDMTFVSARTALLNSRIRRVWPLIVARAWMAFVADRPNAGTTSAIRNGGDDDSIMHSSAGMLSLRLAAMNCATCRPIGALRLKRQLDAWF